MQDLELSIEQAMTDFKRLGCSDNWINKWLKSINKVFFVSSLAINVIFCRFAVFFHKII